MSEAKSDAEWRIKKPVSLRDFEMGVTLGTGSFGRVRIATHKVRCSGRAVAEGGKDA